MGGKRVTLEKFILDSNTKHSNKYDYSKSVYTKGKDKIIITCRTHGDFKIRADAHRIDGQGCPNCRRLRASQAKIKKNEKTILSVFKKVHGDKYLYDNFVYMGDRYLSTITCRVHGDFKQTPNAHKVGKGCGQCAKQNQNYRRSNYIEACNKKYNGKSNIYLLKIKDIDGKIFYKIGITVQNIKGRFSRSKMPYEYEVIRYIGGDAEKVFNIELKIKQELSRLRYKPLLKMAGSRYECFSFIPHYVYDLVDSLVDCSDERIKV